MPRPRLALAGILALVAVLSAGARLVHHHRTPLPGGDGWFSADADSSYQMRRALRALEEGRVARTDPYLNHPHGSAIPWPPGYVHVLRLAALPGLPAEPEARRAHVERRTASLPFVFGVLTSVVTALAGAAVAGRAGALVAGTLHALSLASILYSRHGNGDHHALVSLLAALVWLLLAAALRRGALERPRAAAAWGAAAGLVAGFALVTWVASLLRILEVELALAALVLAHARRPRPGLWALSTAFHLAALAVALPACATSPWRLEQPWVVVNLSWFHPAFLALGALALVPLAVVRGERGRKLLPFGIAAGLAAVGLALAATPIGAGMREGFAWVSSVETFMADIGESRPLVGPGADPRELVGLLGWAVPLLPVAWLAALVRLVRRGPEDPLLPFVAAAPSLALQAGAQMRFAESLAVPAAVLLGWGAARLAASRAGAPLRRLPGPAAAALAVLVAALSQGDGVAGTARLTRVVPEEQHVAARALYGWLRARGAPGGVLAHWDRGHPLEWAADRPTVATNFGSYVGVESFRHPPRFFLSTDLEEAERLLAERDVRHVLTSIRLPRFVPLLEKALGPPHVGRFAGREGKDVRLLPAFADTLLFRLLVAGTPEARVPEHARRPPPGFLRLVHVSPLEVEDPPLGGLAERSPYAWLWERVEGARVEARATPGTPLEVEVRLAYPGLAEPLAWSGRAAAGPDGLARVRVPYATLGPSGDGRPLGPARWRLGADAGELAIAADDVAEGRTLRVPAR